MDPGYTLTSENIMLALWILGGLAAVIVLAIIVDSFLKQRHRSRHTAGSRTNFIVAYFKRTRHLQRTISREMGNRRWHKHRSHERDKRL